VLTIREAVAADDARIAEIAIEGDAGADDWYLRIVRAEGRLLVAENERGVVAYGGMVDAEGVAMVSDLFVTTEARGSGIGGLLLTELLAGWVHRMTCSSRDPAALKVYERHGMMQRTRLHYLRAPALGGGPPLEPAPWQHGRESLVNRFAEMGATVTADVVVSFGDIVEVHRLFSPEPEPVLLDVMRAAPAGTPVEVKVLASHPLSAWLADRVFEPYEYDTWCSTPMVELDPHLAAVDAGLF